MESRISGSIMERNKSMTIDSFLIDLRCQMLSPWESLEVPIQDPERMENRGALSQEELKSLKIQFENAVLTENSRLVTMPGISVTFAVNRAFQSPEFAAVCDQPCAVTNVLVGDPGEPASLSTSGQNIFRTNNPRVGVFRLGNLQTLSTGRVVYVTLRSTTLVPVTDASIRPYSESDQPQ